VLAAGSTSPSDSSRLGCIIGVRGELSVWIAPLRGTLIVLVVICLAL
jgi:hypothetical protein